MYVKQQAMTEFLVAEGENDATMDVGAVWHWAKHVNKADGVRRSGPA